MPDLMALVGSCQIAIAAFIGKKPSFLLKRSVSWVGVQDELLVPGGEPDETSDDLFAKPAALVVRVHCDVGNVRTVEAVGQRPPRANEVAGRVDEARELAVGEHRHERVRRLVSKRCESVQLRELGPSDCPDLVNPRVLVVPTCAVLIDHAPMPNRPGHHQDEARGSHP